ncbi:hypothetical protein OOZ63_10950 [Paucibacter sp. PLA-PC-4]|uniref:hypothetical protein n=1 Tax=Paucibacter sp. PLA-PC-4 TaxID=2993655 RepID=UPI002248A8D9|nr:hypothetical protein [Paucibacter sp. PLA-PC-4]MCX2862358.1 hypothetical protein [Paucibacter sp. PLA-PC-4]
MDSGRLIRKVALCVVLAGAETLHGIARTTLAIPCNSKERAIMLSPPTVAALAFAICWMLVPSMGLQSQRAHLNLGFGLAAFTASVAIGRSLLRKSSNKARDLCVRLHDRPGCSNLLCCADLIHPI